MAAFNSWLRKHSLRMQINANAVCISPKDTLNHAHTATQRPRNPNLPDPGRTQFSNSLFSLFIGSRTGQKWSIGQSDRTPG